MLFDFAHRGYAQVMVGGTVTRPAAAPESKRDG
jgi:hypothetical protein